MNLFCMFSVPPQKPIIQNDNGEEIRQTAGPYFEGDQVKLKCIVLGGNSKIFKTNFNAGNLTKSRIFYNKINK